MSADRHILHIDMDAFFAAVEQLDDPALRGKPVLVGGDPRGRGVVSTASYEARPFGCRSAMPMAQAMRLCPQAILVRPRFERYSQVSRQVFDILEQFTPLVEPLSIDEAFLDLTGSVRLLGTPQEMARRIKQRIRETTGLTASVGLAPSKFVAKLASDVKKPDGLVIVDPGGVQGFLDPLPIWRLWGVGKATLPRFERLGVHTFGDARRLPETQLREAFGESGTFFHELVHGRDDRPVVPDREAKSLSHEITFATDIDDDEYLRGVLLQQTDHVARRLRRHALMARTVFLKIRYADFTTITRRTTLDAAADQTDVLWQSAGGLFDAWSRQRHAPVRLLGMGVTGLTTGAGEQLGLFEQPRRERPGRLDQAVDQIIEKFGDDAIRRARGMNRED